MNLISYYTESRNLTEGDLVRGQIAIESLLWSAASPGAFAPTNGGRLRRALLSTNFSVAYGYAHTFSDVPSNEVHTKFIYALPRIDMQATVTGGMRRYDLGRRSRDRYPVTLGLETGYGFVFVHLGLSDEYHVDALTSDLRHTRSIQSGVTVVPRKPVWSFSDEKCRADRTTRRRRLPRYRLRRAPVTPRVVRTSARAEARTSRR